MLKLNELYRKVARQIKTVFSDVELNEILDLEDIEYEKPGKSYLFFKRFFDIVISLIAIILLSPLMLIIAVIVKAEDGGYVIHKRKCIRPADYKTFTIYKFRSMRTDADDLSKWLSVDEISEYKKEIKLENDPRITKCGTFLRKLSLDELPQLFNILAGSMSLVGPRPIVPEEGVNYKDKLPMLLDTGR